MTNDDERLQHELLVKLGLKHGAMNLWTGIGDFCFDGDTYVGVGKQLTFSIVDESDGIYVVKVTGIPPWVTALAEVYKELPVTIWSVGLGSSGNVERTPTRVFAGWIDNTPAKDGYFRCSYKTAEDVVKRAMTMPNDDDGRYQYHPALITAFLIEDQGLEVDWDTVYEVLEEFPPETIDRWRREYLTGKRMGSK